MSSSKRPRIDVFCKSCQNLEEEKKETVILTDPRLNTLYSSDENSLSEDIPQHRITSFAIHDSDRRFCWFNSKPIEDGNELFLCGNVQPIVSEISSQNDGSNQSDKSEIEAQMIGPLQEWWFAGFDGGSKLIIGVESEFASYILCEPNEDYLNLFTKSTKNMLITKLIIEFLLKNPDSSYEDLISSMEERDENFNEESVLLFSQFIVEQIRSFDSAAEEDETLLSETSAVKTLVQLSGVGRPSKSDWLIPNTNHKSHVRPIARIDARRAANSDTLTCATPLVTKFFDSVFKDVIQCEDNISVRKKRFENTYSKKRCEILGNEMSKKLSWVGPSVYEDRFARTSYYSSIKINDITLSCGQFVVFKQNDNSLGLGRLMFMFSTSDKQKFCHIHCFCWANDTILGETAPNRFVFMTNNCDNIEAQNIVNKIEVLMTNEMNLNSVKDNCETYLCTKLYTSKCGRFEDIPSEAFNSDLKCINCLIIEKREKQKTPQLIDQINDGSEECRSYKKMNYKNQSYCVGDSALISSDAFDLIYFDYENSEQLSNTKVEDEDYDHSLYPERYRKGFTDFSKVLNNDLPKTLNIALIDEIFTQNCDSTEETKLSVTIFYRPHNIYQNYSDFRCCDLNLLYLSNQKKVIDVKSVVDKCRVIYSKQSPKTNFYIQTKLFYFNQCFDFENKSFFEPKEELIKKFDENKDETSDHFSKLNILDLFAGCGGMSYGFHELGLVSELWAIEKDYSAVQSFKSNFKSAHVLHDDINNVLDQLIKGCKCDRSGQLLPKKNQIDLILGGPPCQGFSGMNRFSSRHYSLFKNSLVVSFLSFVDYFRPKYLIFENVRNFANFNSCMVFKLMLSCLISMGYQCHSAILQSGSYGLPQNRRRTVIIGSSAGNRLPPFPKATHVFSRRRCHLSLNIDNKKYWTFSKKSCAQFRTITVDDAISDLPQLKDDYTCDEVRTYPFFDNITHYQKILRKDCEPHLYDHYCKKLSPLSRLRIENIPKLLGSDWRDLPNISYTLTDGTLIPKLNYNFNDVKNGISKSNELRGVCACAQDLSNNGLSCNPELRQENTLIPWCLVHTANRQYNWSGLYGRLALNSYFPTTVTNLEPISKQGRVLHPNQDRIISIREAARSQGFPDHFVFKGTIAEKYRQIGNAVPVPLSFALSRQFLVSDQ